MLVKAETMRTKTHHVSKSKKKNVTIQWKSIMFSVLLLCFAPKSQRTIMIGIFLMLYASPLPDWGVRWPLLSPAPPVPLPADPPGFPLLTACNWAPGPGYSHHSGLEAAWPCPAAACTQVCNSSSYMHEHGYKHVKKFHSKMYFTGMCVSRQSPAVKTPDEYNAAYRLPEKVGHWHSLRWATE